MDSEESDTDPDPNRGLLVPVANPEGVAPLLSIAFAALDPDDPPVRVLALVRRPDAAADMATPVSGQPVAPSTAALDAAIAYARARGVEISPRAIWSANPAQDILATAQSARVAWIVLGYHRANSGGGAMGGVVREVLARSKALPINIGVFVQGTAIPFERVYAAFDSSPDGQAALGLAVRIARAGRTKLRALLVSGRVEDTGDELLDMVHDARKKLGRQFHSDVLGERSLKQLFKQTPGRLLIVGRKFADEVAMPLDEVPGEDRCVIVVQGAAAAAE
ncbi:MAG: universal stress protein [Candidatus Binataceae bacterium]